MSSNRCVYQLGEFMYQAKPEKAIGHRRFKEEGVSMSWGWQRCHKTWGRGCPLCSEELTNVEKSWENIPVREGFAGGHGGRRRWGGPSRWQRRVCEGQEDGWHSWPIEGLELEAIVIKPEPGKRR